MDKAGEDSNPLRLFEMYGKIESVGYTRVPTHHSSSRADRRTGRICPARESLLSTRTGV